MASQTPLGFLSTTVFDAAGRAIASIDPLGCRSTTVYGARGVVRASEIALGFRTTMAYDGVGNAETVMNARGHVSTTVCDALNRVSAHIARPDGTISSYTYGGDGLRRTKREPGQPVTTMVWDGSDYLGEV